ncbi:hypothetical protein ADL21_18160 [Streptomyces albus subsp. albus]|nr:hypothetical protein ADL21_18160 [Streptomyces albus subsp. albus]
MLCPVQIRAAQTGNAEATGQVLDSLEGMIYRLAEKRMAHASGLSAGYGDALDDLRQEGRVAALEALARYNPDGGAKFSTYAHTRIKGAILDTANTRSAPTVSADAIATLKGCLGIVGGDMEAAEYLATVLPSGHHRLSATTAHMARLALEGAESLDAPLKLGTEDAGAATLADSLPAPEEVPADLADASDAAREDRARKHALAHALLETLHGNADRIVRMVYGFDPEPHLFDGYDANGLPIPDHKAIAEALGITVATSRQTLKRALDRLRTTVQTLVLEGAELDVELAA